MHASALRARSLGLVLGFALALGCSTAEPTTQPAGEDPSFDQLRPHVGDPAPQLSLESLGGTRVSLPMSKQDRAAVLIFGSFS